MADYQIKISIGNEEYSNEFRYNHIRYEWELFRNGLKTPYTIKLMENDDWTHYDLYKNNDHIKSFEWEEFGFGYQPNLLEVLTYIMRLSQKD